MALVVSKESTWVEDVKGQILDRLDADDFISVEKLAALALKVQGVIGNGSNSFSFTCAVCKRTFQRRSALREHLRYRHSEIKCKVCGKIFKSKNGLSAHLRTDGKRNPHGTKDDSS